MDEVLWLSALGGLLALDHALLGQFMLSQPLVVGSLFGALLGDLPTGLFVGALVQLIWLGVISVGAYIPPDYTITGGVAVALAETFTHRVGLAPGPSCIAALAAAIPAGALEVIAGAGHNAMWDRAEAFNRLALAFLARQP